MAALAEDRKVDKYRDLPRSHLFCPLSIETMGAMGPRSLELVREVGYCCLWIAVGQGSAPSNIL